MSCDLMRIEVSKAYGKLLIIVAQRQIVFEAYVSGQDWNKFSRNLLPLCAISIASSPKSLVLRCVR